MQRIQAYIIQLFRNFRFKISKIELELLVQVFRSNSSSIRKAFLVSKSLGYVKLVSNDFLFHPVILGDGPKIVQRCCLLFFLIITV